MSKKRGGERRSRREKETDVLGTKDRCPESEKKMSKEPEGERYPENKRQMFRKRDIQRTRDRRYPMSVKERDAQGTRDRWPRARGTEIFKE